MYLSRLGIKSLALKAFNMNKCYTSVTCSPLNASMTPLLSVFSPRIDISFGKKTIAEELGIPEPPKRPKSAFILYYLDEMNNYSHIIKFTEKVKVLSQTWQTLDESIKSKYHENYKIEQENYEKKLKEYENNLTPEQIMEIKNLKRVKKIQKEAALTKRKLKRESEEFGKPKHPGNPVTLFMEVIKKEDYHPKDFLKISHTKWKNLPESDKEIYRQKSKKLMDKYRLDLYAWEITMLEKGRKDMVRVSTLSTLSSDKKRQLNIDQSASKKNETL